MAITPVAIPQVPSNHPSLAGTDFDRSGDMVPRIDGFPVEEWRFTGDGATTAKTLQTGFIRAIAGLVFNMTDGTYWPIATTVDVNPSDPTKVDIAGIPADTDVYLIRIWGEKTVPESAGAINDQAPTVPDGLTTTVDSAVQITLDWSASEHPNRSVTGYQHRVDGGSAVDDGNVLTKAVTGLTTATSYDFEVRAYVTDEFGNTTYSDWSPVVSDTTS